MQNNVKSSSVAGILGVFLGAFGGHDWYLGNTKKAITHVCLCVGGIIMLMIGLILRSLLRDIPALDVLSICVMIAAYVIIVGNGIWGFIEGVMILAQGDAGLAAKGYQVAAPTLPGTMPTLAPENPTNAVVASNTPVAPATISGEVEKLATPVAQDSNMTTANPVGTQSAATPTNTAMPIQNTSPSASAEPAVSANPVVSTTIPAAAPINPASEPVVTQPIADPTITTNSNVNNSSTNDAVATPVKPTGLTATSVAPTNSEPTLTNNATTVASASNPETSANPTTSTPEPAAITTAATQTTSGSADSVSSNPATPNV